MLEKVLLELMFIEQLHTLLRESSVKKKGHEKFNQDN